jgi:cytochrome c oxidase cbb3-type subunit 1
MVFWAISYTVTSLQGSLSALRSVSEVTHFTHHTIAHAHLGMYAFFTMVMFGSMYYIFPRITQREWPSAGLISVHFWGAALGIVLYVVPLSVGGILQGQAMNDATIPFLKVVGLTIPYLKIRTLAGVILAVGHLAFAVNIVWMLVRVFGPYKKPLAIILSGNDQPVPVGK